MTALPPTSAQTRHIPALDGVRGLAVLIVMALHFMVLKPDSIASAVVIDVIGLGWAGVDLFFVLSGFLITGILVDAKGDSHYFRNFYARRTLRIFPLYYAFLLVVLVIWPALNAAGDDPLGAKLLTAAYLGNFVFAFQGWEGVPGHTTHLWSLAIEEQFYLIWPILVFSLTRARLFKLCVAMIVGALIVRVGFHALWPTGLPGYALLPARADTLAAGALLAMLVRREGWQVRLRPWIPRLVAVGSGLLLATVLTRGNLGAEGAFFTPLHLNVQLLAYPGVMLLSVALILWAVLPTRTGEAHGVVEGSLLQSFGRVSYGMYLFHVPLRNLLIYRVFPDGRFPSLLGSTMLTQLLVLAGAVALTYGVSLASWRLFEAPILRLKRHFESERSAPQAVQLAA